MATVSDLWGGTEPLIDLVTIWHKDDIGTSHVYRVATIDLANPVSYLGGPIPGRLLDCDSERCGTDAQGQWRSSSMTASVGDADQYFRRWLGNTYQAKLKGATIAHDQLSLSDYRSKASPTRVFLGVIDDVQLAPDWTVTFSAVDALTPRLDETWPKTFIATTNFSGCLTRVIGLPEPMLFGTAAAAHPIYGGEWPGIYTGVPKTISGDPSWRQVLISRMASSTITSIWYKGPSDAVSVDVTAAVAAGSIGIVAPFVWPAGWALAHATTYVTINGRDYTLCYVNSTWAQELEAGTGTISFGLTSMFGGDVPTSFGDFLDNFVLPTTPYETGTAKTYTDAAFADGGYKRDISSFTAAIAACSATAAWGLREATPLREIIAAAALSGDLTLGIQKSGAVTAWCDESGSLPSTTATGHADTADILDRSFVPTTRKVENVLPYSYRPDFFGSEALAANQELRDATSVTAHGEQVAQPCALSMIRDSSSATFVMARRLTRTKTPVTDATLSVGGLHNIGTLFGVQVGRPTQITHREAPGGIVGYGDVLRALAPSRWWRFGEQPEQAPTVATDAMGVSPGTYAGTPQLGVVGATDDGSTGLEADGVDDEVTLASPIATTTTCTFLFWIRPEDFSAVGSGGVQWLWSMSAGNAAVRFLQSTKQIDVVFASTLHANTTALTVGAWYLVGISIAGGSGTFYLNGVADGTFSSYAGYSVNRLLNIPSGALWAKGGFRDFALWIGTALTAQQHAALYAARTLNRSAMGWTGKLVRCDRMAYRMRERRLDLDVREWVTLT